MEKYLKRLCNAIIADKFNEEKYRAGRTWHGKFIQTEPLFFSYGIIGFTANVFDGYKNICTVSWDGELKELLIDDEPYKEYINSIVLETYDITCSDDNELECYTDAGGVSRRSHKTRTASVAKQLRHRRRNHAMVGKHNTRRKTKQTTSVQLNQGTHRRP